MAGEDRSDQENAAIVAQYFSMLEEDLAGQPYNKAERNREMQRAIGRSRGSIEYKHQNISAVLKALGEDWIPGYKPAFNVQGTLIDAVARWLQTNPGWLQRPPAATATSAGVGPADSPNLWIGPPPTRGNALPPKELDEMMAVARQFDVAGRDERNRALGRAGERRVYLHERAMLMQCGRKDLADRVRWISDEEGDGAGYDIASFEPDGRERLVEVKTTNGWERTPFHVSRNELAVSEARCDIWCLVRLWSFSRTPRAFDLRPPLAAHVELMPTSFQASFR